MGVWSLALLQTNHVTLDGFLKLPEPCVIGMLTAAFVMKTEYYEEV